MNQKSQSNNLGSLIKNRFNHGGRRTVDNNSLLHTTEVQDGYDWGRLNLQSVTEESSFQEFLRTAELVDTGIQAEPHWTAEMSAQDLQTKGNLRILEWRRGLSMLQEEDGLLLTPYEKNLDFWHQLWRVVERSDVVKMEQQLNSMMDKIESKPSSPSFTVRINTRLEEPKVSEGIGLVGCPNVGKSSTINSLTIEKKVSVSATPGKTKHFQTLYLDKDLQMCDFPYEYNRGFMNANGQPDHARSRRSRVGLENMGNTCYVNSILQALMLTKHFRQELLSIEIQSNIFIMLQRLFALMLFSNRPAVSPQMILKTACPPTFHEGHQQDCSEFLGHLMESLNTQQKAYFKQTQTLVQKIFDGSMSIVSKCLNCGTSSEQKESFRNLDLSFPDNTETNTTLQYSVEDLLECFCSIERLDADKKYFCDICKVLCVGERTINIVNPPNYLVLTVKHLKFYEKTTMQVIPSPKVLVKVWFENELTEKFVPYRLYAAVVHYGTMDSGHYYTFGSDEPDNGNWYLFNDSNVSECDIKSLKSLRWPNTPYVLFYEREYEDNHPAVITTHTWEDSHYSSLNDLPTHLQTFVNDDNHRYAMVRQIEHPNSLFLKGGCDPSSITISEKIKGFSSSQFQHFCRHLHRDIVFKFGSVCRKSLTLKEFFGNATTTELATIISKFNDAERNSLMETINSACLEDVSSETQSFYTASDQSPIREGPPSWFRKTVTMLKAFAFADSSKTKME